MAEPVETDGRRRRSRRTRAGIVAAASQLFVEHGYLATTIEAVAEHAGVAVQTVYYVFGTKRNLLAAVLDASIAGDVEPVPVIERPWVDTLATIADPEASVAHMIESIVAILERSSPIYEVVRRSAADADVAALLDDNRRRRREDQRRLIEVLAQSGTLRLDVDTAADVFYGLINEEVFQLLTTDCGWDVPRFRRWVTSLMLEQLVGTDRRVAKRD